MNRILYAASLLAALGAPVFADLNDFRNDVEKQEQNQPAPTPAPGPSDERRHGDHDGDHPSGPTQDDLNCASTVCNIGVQACSGLDWVGMGSAWSMGNASVRYSPYPWATDTFIQTPKEDRANQWSPFTFEPGPGQPGWYCIQTGYVLLKGMGSGAEAALRGQFNGLIGPDIDATWITDGSLWFVASRFGLRLSLFQSDPLSLSVYGQVDTWSGVLNRLGGSFGLEWSSLPFKPFKLTVRTGMQVFDKFVLADDTVRAGVFVGPLEIQAGWTWWNLLGNGSIANTYQGPYLGLAYHW